MSRSGDFKYISIMENDNNDSLLKQTFVTQTHGYCDVSTKRDMWRQIAVEQNGEFSISRTSGNVLEIHKLYILYKGCEIKITESDTRPLKFEIEFDSLLDYNMTIGWEGAVERLLKRIGLKEIETGNEKFDNNYLIKSKDSGKTINFFTPEIMSCLLKYNVYSVSYQTNSKKRKANLLSTITRTNSEKNAIVDLIELHKNMIDRLKVLRIVE